MKGADDDDVVDQAVCEGRVAVLDGGEVEFPVSAGNFVRSARTG